MVKKHSNRYQVGLSRLFCENVRWKCFCRRFRRDFFNLLTTNIPLSRNQFDRFLHDWSIDRYSVNFASKCSAAGSCRFLKVYIWPFSGHHALKGWWVDPFVSRLLLQKENVDPNYFYAFMQILKKYVIFKGSFRNQYLD